MGEAAVGARITRWWFAALVTISAFLVVITALSYAFAGHGSVSRVLFWVGLGGENNLGAWWSGMLLALAAFLAFDGHFDDGKSLGERRGWLALGIALLLLSFDEVASLHEYLSRLGIAYLAVLGIVGLALAAYGMAQLRRGGTSRRTLARLLLAFGLLATVPVHETLQHTLVWTDPLIYGIRAFLEEGTEITAMLIFVSVTRANSAALVDTSVGPLAAPVHWRRTILIAAVAAWPLLDGATFALPTPGGPADWLASTLLLSCTLLALRSGAMRGALEPQAAALALFYLLASAAATAVSFKWNPVIFGAAVNLRGVVFALLVANAAMLLRAGGRRVRLSRYAVLAGAIAVAGVTWPSSQALWCGLPPAVALWLYAIESVAAARPHVPDLDVANRSRARGKAVMPRGSLNG